MRKLILLLATTAAFTLAGSMIGGRSQAALIDAPIGLRTAADAVTVIETVQFHWQGRRYCWYEAGWRGPGWPPVPRAILVGIQLPNVGDVAHAASIEELGRLVWRDGRRRNEGNPTEVQGPRAL
jgi:hypothetical protein